MDDTNVEKLPDDTLLMTHVTSDRFYMYSQTKPNGEIDRERCALPVFMDVDGSIQSLPKEKQIKAFEEKFHDSYKKQIEEHLKSISHQTVDGLGTHAELIFPEGPFDEHADLAEMFIMGRSTCFKIRLKNGNTYPVIFETYGTLENAVKSATKRGSFLYPYPCHIILCHVGVEVMKYAIELMSRETKYFSKIRPNQEKFVPKIIEKNSKNPTITFANGSNNIIKINIVDGVELVPVAAITDKGKKYTFNFFNLAMIKSAVGLNEDSKQKWIFFSSPNMIILDELTVPNIQNCLNEIYREGVFEYYAPADKLISKGWKQLLKLINWKKIPDNIT